MAQLTVKKLDEKLRDDFNAKLKRKGLTQADLLIPVIKKWTAGRLKLVEVPSRTGAPKPKKPPMRVE